MLRLMDDTRPGFRKTQCPGTPERATAHGHKYLNLASEPKRSLIRQGWPKNFFQKERR